jgi:AGZA family xanthine/uracil permease-like MFS transporter
MLHAYGWTQGDTVVDLRWGAGAPWTAGYLGAAAFLVVVPWVTRPRN